MAMPERALSPEEMGLPQEEEQKPKLTILKGGKKEDMVQGYSEIDAHNLEDGIKSLVDQGLLDQNLADRQIQDIWAKAQKVVAPGEARDRYSAQGEIGEESKEKMPEKAEILGKEYERMISYDDIPSMFETLDDTREMNLLDDNEVQRQKFELISKLQEQSGWRLLENENLQNILSQEKLSKGEIKAVIDNVKESYNPRSDQWSATRNFEEIDKALVANLVSKEDAQQEKLQLLDGVESSVGVNLSGARELVEKNQLNAEEFEAMVMDAVGKGVEEKQTTIERQRLNIQPLLISNIERDEMNVAINQQLENYQSLINTKEVTKEEAKILAQKKQKMLEMRKEINLNYDVIDIQDVPGLVGIGELSPERARDMMGDDLERTQKTTAAIEKALKYKELRMEDGAIARGYGMIEQLNAAGKIDFKSTDLIILKDEINELGSKLYRESKKKKKDKGVFSRIGDYFRTRYTEAGKKEVEAEGADRKKFAELLQQRADMENKFWSVARLSSQDQDVLLKYNVFERKQTTEEEESTELQVYPQQVEKVMQEIKIGKIDPANGLEMIKKYRKIAEKKAEEFAVQEYDADQVKRASDLIEQLFNKNILSFNKANFLEVLAITGSEFTPPAEKVKAREKLLKMESEVYKSINQTSFAELGEALRAFRE